MGSLAHLNCYGISYIKKLSLLACSIMNNPEDPRNRRYLFDNQLIRLMSGTDNLFRQLQFVEEYSKQITVDKDKAPVMDYTRGVKRSLQNIFHEVSLIKEQLLILHNQQDSLEDNI